MLPHMASPIAEQILFLVAGALLTLVGTYFKIQFDRRTYCSTRIFELRIEALNQIWQAFNEMKGLYASRIQVGFPQWIQEYQEQAGDALSHFRRSIDNAQVVLPPNVIDVLRKMDEYFYLCLTDEDIRGGEYQGNLMRLLDQLTTEVNESMSKRTQKFVLRLRT